MEPRFNKSREGTTMRLQVVADGHGLFDRYRADLDQIYALQKVPDHFRLTDKASCRDA